MEELLFEYYDIAADDERRRKALEEKEAVPQQEHDWAAEEAAKEEAEEAARDAQAAAEAHAAEVLPALHSDIIVEENVASSDDKWAEKHLAAAEKTLSNPTAEQVDTEDGDISATFGE